MSAQGSRWFAGKIRSNDRERHMLGSRRGWWQDRDQRQRWWIEHMFDLAWREKHGHGCAGMSLAILVQRRC
ncbi:hypothetical protein M0R45_021048 [Rubus argutus]|uniref:Uncharacterized protein n=1 Tax=Rubus argutus TaxID=59490 RepID=A0AAW1XAM1_RUBAR